MRTDTNETAGTNSRRRSPVRGMAMLLTLLLAALVAAGCGSDDANDDDGSSDARAETTAEEPSGPREPTTPEPAEQLTKDLGEAGTALTEAGCTYGRFDLETPTHVEVGDDLESNSFPPTNGRHYEDWGAFGLYDEQVEDGYVVHNLEHGGVAVWFGTEVDEETQDAVAELLDDDEKWMVMPRDDIEGLYSAAWGLGLSCSPAALEQLGAEATARALDTWYETVESTGSEAEKDIPAYAGAIKDPAPVRDISTPSPF